MHIYYYDAALLDVMIFLFVLLHVDFSSLTIKLQDEVEEKIRKSYLFADHGSNQKRRKKGDTMRPRSENYTPVNVYIRYAKMKVALFIHLGSSFIS